MIQEVFNFCKCYKALLYENAVCWIAHGRCARLPAVPALSWVQYGKTPHSVAYHRCCATILVTKYRRREHAIENFTALHIAFNNHMLLHCLLLICVL